MKIRSFYKTPIFIIFIATLFFYFPILINQNLLLDKPNDLNEFFWPLFYFAKQQIFINHQIPFWNNMFLAGTPLLPDPQSPISYPVNLIFLFLPIDKGFLISIFVHIFLGGLFFYYLLKKVFNFQNSLSLIGSFVYILNPRLSGYIEAGHFGLVVSITWIPLAFIALFKLYNTCKFKWILLFSISLAALYLTHTINFILTFIFMLLCFLFLTIKNRTYSKQKIFSFFISIIIFLGLISIVTLPQIEWAPQTTRFLLLQDRDVYPKWETKKEILVDIFIPWIKGLNNFWQIDTEKWVPFGLTLSLLSFLGFLKLNKVYKIPIGFLIMLLFLIALNNLNPFYNFLLNQNWYVILRVTTRSSIFLYIILIILTINFLNRVKNKNLLISLVIFLVLELLFLSWGRLYKPSINPPSFATQNVINFIKQDSDHFRIFCTTKCFSQKNIALNNLETIEGYNTVQQTNYYQTAWQLTNSFWDYYTLAIPPFGILIFDPIQPDPISLGFLNTKYIISPHKLTNTQFIYLTNIDNFNIYKNNLYQTRAFSKETKQKIEITSYQPNQIDLTISNQKENIILSEIYNKDWQAKDNGNKLLSIKEGLYSTREITPNPNSKEIILTYNPKSFVIGKIITLSTIFILTIYLIIKNWIKKK